MSDQDSGYIKKICENCREEFSVKNDGNGRKKKTCSRKCQIVIMTLCNISSAKLRRLPDPICQNCGNEFRPKGRAAKALSKYKFFSISCSAKNRLKDPAYGQFLREIASRGHEGWTEVGKDAIRERMTGANNPAWKGGLVFSRAGYVLIRCPDELKEMSPKSGYIPEHRMIIACVAGRTLSSVECVHHRDHNRTNNLPDNLELWPDNGSHKAAEFGYCVDGVCNLWKPMEMFVDMKRYIDPASFNMNDVFLIWHKPYCVFTLDSNIDGHHILGRGQVFGYNTKTDGRNMFGSVYNFAPLTRSVHDGPQKDSVEMRWLLLRLAAKKVQDAINHGEYELKDRDYEFLEFSGNWKLKNQP